jgi:hypothetical protein
MSDDEESYLVKPHDPAEIIQLRDSAALSEFLKDPRSVIAGALIEAFSHGPSAFTQPLIKIGVASLTGRAAEQFAQEIKSFREKGKIPADWAEKPNCYQTWVELLRVIDEESPDETRLEALKAMFFAVNKVGVKDGTRILAYQLFQITKKLNSNELLVLKAVYENYQKVSHFPTKLFREWTAAVANYLGHSMIGLVEVADQALVDNRLLGARYGPEQGSIHPEHWRLTELGLEFCQNIERYNIDKGS